MRKADEIHDKVIHAVWPVGRMNDSMQRQEILARQLEGCT